MKKNIIYSLSLFLLLSLSACNQWLEVEPKTEIKSDKMFENETGFRDALIGCYMMMADSTLYGRESTVCFFDVLAQQYDMATNNPYTNLKQYRYESYTGTIDGIWQKTYRIIANLNALLEVSDEKKAILHPTTYGIIKGEAIGLRAFLHFELLRIFGWGNLENQPSNLDKLSIPYVTEYSKVLTKQSTVKEVLGYIHRDLAEADSLLNYWDSYGTAIKGDDYEMDENDLFFKERKSRFNYYAVKATEARVCMWEGKYKEALEAIEELFMKKQVIPWVDPESSVHVEEKMRDLSFTAEHIFYLEVNQLYKTLRPYVEQYKINADFSSTDNEKVFYTTKTKGESLYEIADGTGVSDIRYMRWFNKTEAKAWTFLKFYEPADSESRAKNKMPLMRKPEMYYYAAECYNNLNNPQKAVDALNAVRVARGILYEKNLPASLSKEEISREIQKEWQKEFAGEGQLFFYYKRLGLNIPNASLGAGDALFVLPLPETEVEIGGREDYGNSINK